MLMRVMLTAKLVSLYHLGIPVALVDINDNNANNVTCVLY